MKNETADRGIGKCEISVRSYHQLWQWHSLCVSVRRPLNYFPAHIDLETNKKKSDN